jgi:hypothetical protein
VTEHYFYFFFLQLILGNCFPLYLTIRTKLLINTQNAFTLRKSAYSLRILLTSCNYSKNKQQLFSVYTINSLDFVKKSCVFWKHIIININHKIHNFLYVINLTTRCAIPYIYYFCNTFKYEGVNQVLIFFRHVCLCMCPWGWSHMDWNIWGFSD